MSETKNNSIPRIVAMGGGGFSMEPKNTLLDDYILSLSAQDCPRICFIPTASGDSDNYIRRFYDAFSNRACRPTHLSLTQRSIRDLRKFIFAQDIIYVGGGNTANLLAIWRVHGLDELLREAWKQGIILCGLSAGSLCWFECGVTDSFGAGQLAPLHDGLRLIAGSHCPHYDGETQRRPVFQKLVGDAVIPGGWAADDGAALVFEGTNMVYAVSSRVDARVYHVRREDNQLIEDIVQPRYLGSSSNISKP